MFEGPEEELVLTENAQPALMAVSLAVARVIETEGNTTLADKAAFVAGHSLGEYSALAAAGALGLSDAARLLKKRGQAMQSAVPVGEGAMAALLGLDLDEARAVAEEAAEGEGLRARQRQCTGAGRPQRSKIGGRKRAIEIAKARGARRCVLLPVSAPFHCALMAPAADVMAEALAEVALAPPELPLVANVTAEPVGEPHTIRGLLVEQVTAMVRWRESVLNLKAQGVESLAELGAGKVLTGLTRRIDRDLTGQATGTPDEIETLLKSF